MKILAIDTSCDDTSVSISDDLKILAENRWSKIKLHEKWGGVVPSEARRQHQEFLEPVIKETLIESKAELSDIDFFAVTIGPGLAIALEPGIQKARELSRKYSKPLIAVNHMAGHIYSTLTQDSSGKSYSGIQDFEFPLLALAISGGHTDLYLMKDHLKFERVGQTIDDAIGEAFDKVGRMLGMPFPAGAKVEEAALLGDPKIYNFPRPLKDSNDYNWSFSGLKTAVLYQIQKVLGDYEPKPGKNKFKIEDLSNQLTQNQIEDLAASFQQAAIDSLLFKIEKALLDFKPKMLIIGGGVIANKALRNQLQTMLKKHKIPLYYPGPIWLCTDNAAMIATAAWFYKKLGIISGNIDRIDRKPGLNLPDLN